MKYGLEIEAYLYDDELLIELLWPFPDRRAPDAGTNGLGLGVLRRFAEMPDGDLGRHIIALLESADPFLEGSIPTTSLASLSELCGNGLSSDEIWAGLTSAVMVQRSVKKGLSVVLLRVDRNRRYHTDVTDTYEMLGHEVTPQALGSSVRRLLAQEIR